MGDLGSQLLASLLGDWYLEVLLGNVLLLLHGLLVNCVHHHLLLIHRLGYLLIHALGLLMLSLHATHHLHLLLGLLLPHNLARGRALSGYHHLAWLLRHHHHLTWVRTLGLHSEALVWLLLKTHLLLLDLLLVSTLRSILLLRILRSRCDLLLLGHRRSYLLLRNVLLLRGLLLLWHGGNILSHLQLLSAHLIGDLALLLFVVV